MNITERNELAADIAARVRLYSWHPMPAELEAVLQNSYGFNMTYPLYLNSPRSSDYSTLRMSYSKSTEIPRLELSFDINGNYNIGRVLWTPEREYNGARTANTIA